MRELTVKNLKLNIRKSLMVILGVMLSVSLIFTILTMVVSLKKTVEKEIILFNGHYHFKTTLSADKLPQNEIEELTQINSLGYAKIDTINTFKPYLQIYSLNLNDFSKHQFKLVEGDYPKTENELVVTKKFIDNVNFPVKLGDTIDLDLGKRAFSQVLDFYPSQYMDGEWLEPISNRSFKIVGIIERPNYTFEEYSDVGYSALTIASNIDTIIETVSFYTLKNPQEYNNHYERIYQDQTIQVSMNTQLLTSQGYNGNNSLFIVMISLAIILITMISITSIFIIKNSFSISIVEQTREFGILKSLGATNKQVSRLILLQGFSLGIIGLGLGLLLGFIASYVVVLVFNHVFNSSISNLTIILVYDPIVIGLTILISLVTVYFSCATLARKSKKLSPLEAIRSSSDVKISHKEVKTPKYIDKLFSIGGLIAYKNVKRNRKKYRATIASIAISVMLFIGMNFFVNAMTMTARVNFTNQNFNLAHHFFDFHSTEQKTLEADYKVVQSVVNRLKAEDQYTWFKSAQIEVASDEFSPSFMKGDSISFSSDGSVDVRINELDEASYQTLLKLNGLDESHSYFVVNQYRNKQDGKIVIDKIFNDLTISFKPVYYDHQGPIIGDERTVELTEIKQRSAGVREFQFYPFVEIYTKPGISDESFIFTNSELFIQASEPDIRHNELQNFLKEQGNKSFEIYNYQDDIKMINNLLFLVQFVGYGFITIISLIGLTNVFNSITSMVISRRKEYATLMSVGMNSKQIYQMSFLESLIIGLKGLIFGIPLGLIITLIIHHFLKVNLSIEYQFPIVIVCLSIILVVVLTYVIMLYSLSKIKSQNIIETIRNENI